MNHTPKPAVGAFDAPPVSLSSYVIGFAWCLSLSFVAYFVATSSRVSNQTAIAVISALAIIQCYIQLRRFLHIGHEFKPRQKLLMFGTMLIVLIIFIAGSLWIMGNLDYRMIHSPEAMQRYIESQDGL